MPDEQEYKGFRIWNLDFQAMNSSTPGVEYETVSQDPDSERTGRMSIPSTGAKYWTEDNKGLARHLEDYLRPMWDTSNQEWDNGVGWTLDVDLYNRLRELVVSSDSAYDSFRTRNANIYSSTNTSGEKTVKLVPTDYTRAMFFKHTSGYRVMIGLSLYAMDGDDVRSSSYVYPNGSIAVDPGFNSKHIYAHTKLSSSTSYSQAHSVTGGLFMAMIPPANANEAQDEFHPEYSIQDENFFVPTMTNIITFIHSHAYSFSNSNSYHSFYSGCSWLKTGTSTAYNSTTSGIIPGTNMKLSLLLDSKANVGLSYKYTYNANTTMLSPIIFLGPLYKKKLYSNDTLCTKSLATFCRNIQGQFTYENATSTHNKAWCSYRSGYFNQFVGSSDIIQHTRIGGFTRDASNFSYWGVYTAYPACDSSVHTNYRYAKAGYTTMGLLDEEIIRWSGSDGLVMGQTYNDGQWIFLGNDTSLYAQDGATGNNMLYPSIRWDAAFNGTKTFA